MPEPSVTQLAASLPGVDPRFIDEHVGRLDPGYFRRFDHDSVARHIRLLAGLRPEAPVALDVEERDGGELVCTVLAFDHPGAFSLIAGILSSTGFDIHSGDVFTWKPPADRTPRAIELRRRRIIDCFTGSFARDAAATAEDWRDACAARLTVVFAGLERGGDSAAAARRAVNEMAAGTLATLPAAREVLYPVQIEIDESDGGRTRMRVISQDTPFFLYAFSAALTLQDVIIERVTIRTEGGRIEDEFEIVDAAGKPLRDPVRIDRIKLSVLLTKQFTSFLGGAPDPLAALVRFEQLVTEAIAVPGQERWLALLGNQGVMRDLAQLLGTSTFLWEDFVRLQYEELLPMLAPHMEGRSLCAPIEELPRRLAAALSDAGTTEEIVRRLNDFKDREVYLYDLDHILAARHGGEESFASGFLLLSRRLTALAELVIDTAIDLAWKILVARFGEPRTVAGLPVRYAALGLGKMGGMALGYASDIEVLLVYGDSGSTAGPEVIGNGEFFDRLMREVLQIVHAKREGIFHIDLRLRPYGAAGPLACSLETFCTYYPQGGPAHSYERLALVRLRAVGGDRALGAQVERLRDEMVYSARSINLADLRELRARQAQEKTGPVRAPGTTLVAGAPRLNAKFSPGALVDLEYAVQILQVQHGATEPRLRTPRIHEALEALASIGVLEKEEAQEIVDGYHFFRRLINGLRMLRGSAQDLVLPALDSDEYLHLARRMGYESEPQLTPAQKLHLDFETHSAQVRAFVERHFGRDTLPGAKVVTVADLIISDAVPEELAAKTLRDKGFSDPSRAWLNLRHIGGTAERRALFARLAILACDILAHRPDPDMALNNWERFLHAVPDPQWHLGLMLSQPMRLEILLSIFSASQFLADTLVRDPQLFEHIGRPEVIHAPRRPVEIEAELAALSAESTTTDAWRSCLRKFRRQEILRIAARDICLGVPTQRIMEEISDLADGIVDAALRRLRPDTSGFCVLAFGKLGARELNYSSDIDLLGVFAAPGPSEEEANRLMETLRAELSQHTTEGYAYRVDLRLRPYGSSGQLVLRVDALRRYYGEAAALWELQALLKTRPVAGDILMGREFLDSVRPLVASPHPAPEVVATITRLRREALRSLSRSLLTTTDVKTGLGGLRDVEFLVQGLQMIHAHDHPELLCGGTLAALGALGRAGLLTPESVGSLSEDYLFLRRVEHFLQIYEDRQTHSLPRDPSQIRALARLMLGSGATTEQFLHALAERFERVQSAYRGFAASVTPGGDPSGGGPGALSASSPRYT
ncbi:MAG TPA: glutamate-ammonia-ligase adenylyltransferase [Spirochaetia bacterium]